MATLRADPALAQLAQRGGAARHRRPRDGDAGRALGIRLSRSAAWRRSTPTTGVITPGGIGFDINCGVRLLRTRLEVAAVEAVRDRLADRLFAAVPAGVGSSGAVPALSARDERRVLERGAAWAVEEGFGRASDLEHCEDGGRLARRRPGRRLRDGADARPVAGRHARLRQSLPGGPAGGSDRRRAGRGRARHRGGTGRRHDPLRLARPRVPGVRRRAARDGRRRCGATASRCPTASSPACRCARPRARRTSGRWPRPRTSRGRTAR